MAEADGGAGVAGALGADPGPAAGKVADKAEDTRESPSRAVLALSRSGAEAAFEDAVRAWIAARHARVDGFVDRHFSWSGSLALHRHALGPDLVRVPANIALAVPQLAAGLGAAGLARAGRLMPRLASGVGGADTAATARLAAWSQATSARLARVNLQQPTDHGRMLNHLLLADLLELPSRCSIRGERLELGRDSLAETLLAHPAIAAAFTRPLQQLAEAAAAPEFAARLDDGLRRYAGSRIAAAEITTALATLGIGGATLHQFTPGSLSLAKALAAAMANKAALASFPLGGAAGGLLAPMWYTLFPAAPGALLTLSSVAGVLAAAAVFATFAGVVADPVQRRLGLHQRRLHRLLDSLEADLTGASEVRLELRDQYVARIFDLADLFVALGARVARG